MATETVAVKEVYDGYSATVKAALADPDGARRALYSYGELIGFQPGGMPPIPVGRGEESWLIALTNANPLWLGEAWEGIEAKDNRKPAVNYKKGQSAQEKGTDDQMAIVQWTENTGAMIDPGMYRATITEIDEETGNFGPQFKFQFVLLDNDGEKTDKEIRAWCSAKWGPKTKLYDWSRALLGKKCPQNGQPIDTDALIGRKADIEVVPYKKQDGSDGTKIGNLYPYKSMTRDEEDDES